MPRNEFKAEDADDDIKEVILFYHGNGVPYAKLEDGVVTPFKNHSGKSEAEVSDQAVDPIEDDPEVEGHQPSLAELRKSHQSVTEAHIVGPAT